MDWNLTVMDDPELVKGSGIVLPQNLHLKFPWDISI